MSFYFSVRGKTSFVTPETLVWEFRAVLSPLGTVKITTRTGVVGISLVTTGKT